MTKSTLPSQNECRHQIGKLGEDIACLYLKRKGFEVIERNYWKKWGEIDIVARKNLLWHFVEVKTVSREIPQPSTTLKVTRETANDFKAEENLHPWKIKRLERTIETYLQDKDLANVDWQLDAISIKLDLKSKRSRLAYIENVF